MQEQSTDSIRLAALDQYIIDQAANYDRTIERLRTDRTIYAIMFILATMGMFVEARLAIDCSNTSSDTKIESTK